MNHTPGPWQADSEGREGWAVNYDSCAEWSHVAVVRPNSEGSRPVDDDEAEANARMIAAAPELLAALKKLLNETDDGTQLCARHIVDDCKAAIAKAEGQG